MALKKDLGRDFLAVLILLFIMLFFALPAVLSMKTRYLGFGRDFSLFIWNVWWFRYALTVLHVNPMQTDYIFYPLGQLLFLQVLSIPHCLLFLCLCKFFTFTTAWNLHYLIAMPLPALSMYILVRHLLKSRMAAVLAAVIFAYCPWMTLHNASLITISSSVSALPLFFYGLLKLDETSRSRWIIFSAFIWGLTIYSDLWTSIYIAFFFTIYVIFTAVQRKGQSRPLIRNALAVLLFFLVFSFPLLYGVATQMADEGGGDVHWLKIEQFSVDPGSYFIPACNHTLFGKVTDPFVSKENPLECTTFMGYSVLILFIMALFRRRDMGELRCFVWTFFVFLTLSLGPSLHFFGFSGDKIFGTHDLGGARISIPLPYALFYFMPILKQMRWPGRFTICVVFSAAILAAWFVKERLLKSHSRVPVRLLIGGLLVALVLFEFLPLPFPSTASTVPPELKMIRDDPEDCSVLFIPLEFMSGPYKVGFHTGEDMLFQVYHQKRLVSGFQSRVPFKKLYTLANLRILKSILLMQHLDQPQVPSNIMDYQEEIKKLPELIRTDRASVNGIISLLKIKYIVIMQPAYLPNTSRYIDYLFGPFKVIDKESIRIYKIPPTPNPESRNLKR
jgi:hypothetical protein